MDVEIWEMLIPAMGVVAPVRDLHNFDWSLSETAVEAVIAKITDPGRLLGRGCSRTGVWAAYGNAPSDNWKGALGRTLDLTVAKVPALDGTFNRAGYRPSALPAGERGRTRGLAVLTNRASGAGCSPGPSTGRHRLPTHLRRYNIGRLLDELRLTGRSE
jgi:hypothetical protein